LRSYTNGEISRYGALFSSAAILLVLEFLGGLRGVAYTDVVQGIALLIGSVAIFIVQHQDLGGMGAMSAYTRSEAFKKASPTVYPAFNNVMPEYGGWSTASFGSFIIKVIGHMARFCMHHHEYREAHDAHKS
jgi:SSS family solute:Na+ symporter